ncbi:hypothetical protein HDU67_007022 [Dinochytrium kinnereticum]|nr:hypothetical protein HDU67_007022 [Dinochytrium kinnereticum]
MPSYTIDNGNFTLKLKPLEKITSLQFSVISIPLLRIQLPVQVNPEVEVVLIIGTHIPEVFVAGNIYRFNQQQEFVYTRYDASCIGINLIGNEFYSRIVFEVPKSGDDPERIAEEITAAVRRIRYL